MSQHDCSSRIVFIVDGAGAASTSAESHLTGWQWEFLRGKLLRAGITPSAVRFYTLANIPKLPDDTVMIGMGEAPLRFLCDKRGIDKWQLSPLRTRDGNKFIATYDMARVQKQYELGLYQELAFKRAYEMLSADFAPPPERFHLNPEFEETLQLLDYIKTQPEVAIDVETGYGQINTVGFAWSESDAVAINVLPDRLNDANYYELWRRIGLVLESDSRKILQNFIYDVSYFSIYGIRTRNIAWDTMWAMKVLWPELKSNLGNVGRFYTRRPYWKDDGKVTDEEGGKKDWGNVRDWGRHYTYNCRDTTGTFESHIGQSDDLKSRGLDRFYNEYIMRLTGPILEMCSNGMPVCATTRDNLAAKTEARVTELVTSFHASVGSPINPRSPKQILTYLKGAGVHLPKKYDKATGLYKESTDASSIKKIRLKRDIPGLAELQEIKTLDKALSSYIKFDMRPDGRLSYSLNGCGTETLRWSGNKDAWDRGMNIQTIPREGGDVSIKSMFVAPDGWSFLEVDLRQAESRFVAYDSADAHLIDMLESGADVHSHVGNAILRQMGKDPALIPKEEFKSTWRQLGKKAGHGLNYGMKARVFVETVFHELDIVISVKDAEAITKAYYGLFPGIPKWHNWIRQELYNKRKLSAPSGWERYFYGRSGDDMFKEGAAFRPQHTIPWITNHLMLHLDGWRGNGAQFQFLAQVHDSLIMLVRNDALKDVAKICLDHRAWHPRVVLPGGEMWIPTEVKYGKCMADLKEWKDE